MAADLPRADGGIYIGDPHYVTLSGNPGVVSGGDGLVVIDLRVPGGVLHGEVQCLGSPNCLAATCDTFADIASTYFS